MITPNQATKGHSFPSVFCSFLSQLRSTLAVSAALVLTVMVSPPFAHAQPQATRAIDPSLLRMGSIEGTLTPPADSHGKSVANLTITVSETGQAATSDKLGHFMLSSVKTRHLHPRRQRRGLFPSAHH